MALPLPHVESVKDCASFTRTVLPLLPQLQTLPTRLNETGSNLDALKELYLTTNPLVTATAFCISLATFFFVFSELVRNHSQVDRFWSILPAVYNGHFAIWARMVGVESQFLNEIAILTCLWSIRLTFNFWRKGGYKYGSEDYRWEIVRSKVNNNRFVFLLFNLVFISATQMALLLLVTTPTYTFLLLSQTPTAAPFKLADVAFSRVAFFFLIIETFADEQQWSFHKAKHEYQKNARVTNKRFSQEDLERGFVVSGLWSLSRHPNFLCEQAIWMTMYLWSCFRTESYYHWAGAGALGYVLIFQGSTTLTESISASKYPEYRDYQARVGRFFPRFSAEPKGKKAAAKNNSKAKSKKSQSEEAAAEKDGKKSK